MVIGKDTRLSGYMIENALVAGFTSVGMDVVLTGPLPTPAIGWGSGPVAIALLVAVSVSVAVLGPRLDADPGARDHAEDPLRAEQQPVERAIDHGARRHRGRHDQERIAPVHRRQAMDFGKEGSGPETTFGQQQGIACRRQGQQRPERALQADARRGRRRARDRG